MGDGWWAMVDGWWWWVAIGDGVMVETVMEAVIVVIRDSALWWWWHEDDEWSTIDDDVMVVMVMEHSTWADSEQGVLWDVDSFVININKRSPEMQQSCVHPQYFCHHGLQQHTINTESWQHDDDDADDNSDDDDDDVITSSSSSFWVYAKVMLPSSFRVRSISSLTLALPQTTWVVTIWSLHRVYKPFTSSHHQHPTIITVT